MKSILGLYKHASSLVNEPHSCLNKITHIMNMPLPCEYIGNFKRAIMITLDDELGIYDVELEGVAVAYNKNSVKFIDKFAEMTGVQPVISCKIQCDLIVFTPRIDCVLEGIVNKVTSKFIGCLIHGCFYASIHHTAPIDERLIGVSVGDAVTLRVVKLEEDGSGVLSIIGEIRALQSNRDNHRTLKQDFITHDATSNVDCGMKVVFVPSNGDQKLEDFDDTSTVPSFGGEAMQVDNTLPVQCVEEHLSQQDVISKDFPDGETTKKKNKEKKKKEKKKHKKRKMSLLY